MTGQTSQVFEAMHDGDRQRYAVKFLLPDLCREKEHIGYMKNEFLVGSSLEHRRVIKVCEMGHFEGGPYLALEFYPHPNLKLYIQQTPDLLTEKLASFIEQAAEALVYFHSKGWIHRDIKPDNFLASSAGEVKLIDFALAQKRKKGLAALFAGKQKIQGTRSYMSPEQIRGQPLDARADIYSFGCSLYEMVSGKCPYTGSDTQDLLTKHLRNPAPSLMVNNKNVTPEFSSLVQRMLAKKAADRPESMEVFLREFRLIKVFKEAPRSATAKKSAASE